MIKISWLHVGHLMSNGNAIYINIYIYTHTLLLTILFYKITCYFLNNIIDCFKNNAYCYRLFYNIFTNCWCKIVIYLCFMLDLFHDKKCCKCIKLFPCILRDFIVLSLVLSWWRIKLRMIISVISRLAHKKFASKSSREKIMWEVHARSWRAKCQAVFLEYFAR